jgi:hypothetical protein
MMSCLLRWSRRLHGRFAFGLGGKHGAGEGDDVAKLQTVIFWPGIKLNKVA